MTTDELIKDLQIQLEVATELQGEYFHELEGAREYIRGLKAILDDANVPFIDGVLQTRIQWMLLNMKTRKEWIAEMS